VTGPQRRPIIGGNWKMNTTLSEAVELAGALAASLPPERWTEVVVFPPFTNLEAVRESLGESRIGLGGQDVFWEERGAFTGEVSAEMLLSVGCKHVICGHSERRHVIGESSEIVNRKVRSALEGELKVILAIGETEVERHGGKTESVVSDQLRRSLEDIPAEIMRDVVIAYEPVWAIGTGVTATPEQAQAAHAFVRLVLVEMYDDAVAEATRIQYGGSVTATNAPALLGCPDVDGALVGGASLKPQEFAAIVGAQERILNGG